MQQPPHITVTFYNQLRDHLEAQKLLYSKGVMARIDKVVALMLLGLGVYLIYIAGFQWWSVLWMLLAVVEWFNLLSLHTLRTTLFYKRNPKFQEEYHLEFSPDSIHFKTASIDSVLQWTHYQRVIENSNMFLLMYGKDLYTLIPKRGFANQDDIDAFRALVDMKVTQENVQ
jgi:hypothetical protein